MTETLAGRLTDLASRIQVSAWRLGLETPGVLATVPMLRGVWGLALRDLARDAYHEVFEGAGPPAHRVPKYIIRPVVPAMGEQTAVELILFSDAVHLEEPLLRAWDVASGMGLGPNRHRFRVRTITRLGPDGRPAKPGVTAWRLDQARSLPDDPIGLGPVTLVFDAPLRLVERQRLIECPSLLDVVRAGLRRWEALASCPVAPCLHKECLAAASMVSTWPWDGRRLDFHRYSGRQQREIDLHGVCGHLVLPDGPGDLWPMLASLCWTHLGKGTVFGLGQPKLRSGQATPPAARAKKGEYN